MKTLQKSITIHLNTIGLMVGLLLIALFLHSCGPTYVTERTVVRHEVAPPPWAPAYDNVEEVHYYYLPDIEVYYDVWRHEYVYMNQGAWIYSSYMPSYYSNYNINDAFVVVLDRRAYEPWRQHQTYVNQYPRYYYQTRYANSNDRNNNGRARGFNENAKTVIYHPNQNSGNGRSENVVRTPNNTNSRQPAQQTQTPSRRDNQYQRTYAPATSQPAQAPTRRDTYSSPSNTTNQSAPNAPVAPTTRRDVTQPSTASPSSAPAVRDARTETSKPANATPVRNDRSPANSTNQVVRGRRNDSNKQPAKVQQSTPQRNSSDSQKKDDNSSGSRR
jgi:hypothetical protein